MAAVTTLSPGQVIEEPIDVKEEQGWQQNLNVRLVCPDCREDPPRLIEDWAEGNVTCDTCGLVLQTHLVDQRSEWRTFASDDGKGDDPSRVGKAEDPNDPHAALQTSIGFNPAGQRDRGLDKAHAYIMKESSQAHLEAANRQIRDVSNGLHIPHFTVQLAEELYRSSYQAKELKGKSLNATTAACILMATRRHLNGLQYGDIWRVANITQKELTRASKALKEVRKKTPMGGIPAGNSATSPAQLCGRHGSRLMFDSQTQQMARRIAEHVSAIGTLDGRNPNTAAGAALYVASHLLGKTPRTLREIAQVAGVNDSTIRGAYKKLLDEKERVFLPEWLGPGKGDMALLPAA